MARNVTVLEGARTRAYSADQIKVTLDASGLAKRIGEAVAERTREAIRSGEEPSGKAQRTLGPGERSRAARGKRSAVRGMGSEGRFPASIGSTSSGDATKAHADVAADPFFDEWQEREASRGVEYFDADGDIEELVERCIEQDLKDNGWI